MAMAEPFSKAIAAFAAYGFLLVLGACGGGGSTSSGDSTSTVNPPPTEPVGTRRIAVDHNDLVYDPTRHVYYASTPSALILQGNRIATISPTDGSISYSALIGSDPGPMALSADGNWLYVGLLGSGELLKLSLPGMNEAGRVQMPYVSLFGQTLPTDIAVSPINSDVVAVALRGAGSMNPAGTVLVNSMTVQPKWLEWHVSVTSVAFDPTGNWVFAYNNSSSDFSLRRLEVLVDGLRQDAVVTTGGRYLSTVRAQDGLLLVDNMIYTDPTMALRGQVATGMACIKLTGLPRVVCLNPTQPQIIVAETTSFGIVAAVPFANEANSSLLRFPVQGPSGQVAVSETTRIVLVEHPQLQ